jgi:hypothetical protein
MVGLRGLMIDFEMNGGVDYTTGKVGQGFHISITDYFIAYFQPNDRASVVYLRFGELMEGIATMIKKRYPDVGPIFAVRMTKMTENKDLGFGSNGVTSVAKTQLIEKLGNLMYPMPGDSKAKIA